MTNAVTLGLNPSFGFGDRIGLATPGHVAAMQSAGAGIEPIFPQQSIREMTRTRRNPAGVMADAFEGMKTADWEGATGADADHLKEHHDVDITVAAGFTFFTIDPSDHVDEHADGYTIEELKTKSANLGSVEWIEDYRGQNVTLSNGTKIAIDEEACLRAAVKYGLAVNNAAELAKYIEQACKQHDQDFEIELSVDETEQPTTLAEHYIVAHRCLDQGMKLVSLAPRFLGDFEKGIDFKGDLDALEKSLHDHAAIAELLGPYKLSLHSGSDKLSMYPALARATKGRFHVKTAGTSYLEALRVVARHDEALFRTIVHFARERYDTDKATYHVSATLDSAPSPEGTSLEELEREYLEIWDEVPDGKGFTKEGRQILHCTFGSVLTHPEYGPAVRSVLETYPDTYTEILKVHFVKHLEALRAGMPE
jgi:hypothetical protein